MKTNIASLLFGLLLLASCASEPAKEEKRIIDPETMTDIEFEETEHDFGKISEGDKVTHVFKFRNIGNKPLTIFSAKGSCGCTVPEYPKNPIAPGEGGEIKVVFNSEGKKGSQSKLVLLESSTIPSEHKLNIKAKVGEKEWK